MIFLIYTNFATMNFDKQKGSTEVVQNRVVQQKRTYIFNVNP